jgi:hypothetical protein
MQGVKAPTNGRNGLIVKITPPDQPSGGSLKHTPCDLVLVIDVSASMGVDAPTPKGADEGGVENYGFSVLDLVKHAANTICATLNEGDRLGIVTFGDIATVSAWSDCNPGFVFLAPLEGTSDFG